MYSSLILGVYFKSRMAIFFKLAVRSAYEGQNFTLGIVQLTNNLEVIVVSCTHNSTICITSRQVLVDIGAQSIIIGKLLTNALELTSSHLEPCSFTILTLVGDNMGH